MLGQGPGTIQGPYGVSISITPDKRISDSSRRRMTTDFCNQMWSSNPSMAKACAEHTYRMETNFWSGKWSLSQLKAEINKHRAAAGMPLVQAYIPQPSAPASDTVGEDLFALFGKPSRGTFEEEEEIRVPQETMVTKAKSLFDFLGGELRKPIARPDIPTSSGILAVEAPPTGPEGPVGTVPLRYQGTFGKVGKPDVALSPALQRVFDQFDAEVKSSPDPVGEVNKPAPDRKPSWWDPDEMTELVKTMFGHVEGIQQQRIKNRLMTLQSQNVPVQTPPEVEFVVKQRAKIKTSTYALIGLGVAVVGGLLYLAARPRRRAAPAVPTAQMLALPAP